MLKLQVDENAGVTDGWGYIAADWLQVASDQEKWSWTARILVGPLAGKTLLEEWRGAFDTAEMSGLVNEMRQIVGGTLRFSVEFDTPIRVEEFDSDFEAAAAAGIRFLGNSFNNAFYGNIGDDRLYGRSGNDFLYGDAGDDHINGGKGRDWMEGGAGDDVYVVNSSMDRTFEYPDDGVDRVISSISTTLQENVENLTLAGDTAIDGTGNALENVLVGNDGVNVLKGRRGDDILDGDSGGDKLFGGLGDDKLKGRSGDDLLKGGAGNDVLNGGKGRDQMEGGAGDDVYYVNYRSGFTSEIVVELTGEGTDLVKSSVDFFLPDNVENLTLTGSMNIKGNGNELNNIIIGNDGDNTIIGGYGDDIIDGGRGDNFLRGGAGNDIYYARLYDDQINVGPYIIEWKDQGFDQIFSYVSDTNLHSNVEMLTLLGGAIEGRGNAEDNVIVGNQNDNKLIGGFGSDLLSGGLGKDVLVGDITSDYEDDDEGPDSFIFASILESRPGSDRDVILDFESAEDHMDLSEIDANALAPGNQTLLFVGAKTFSGVVGELRYANGVVSADVDGDASADFEIEIANRAALTEGDFIL